MDPAVPQTWNSYGYAHSNPIGNADPDGLMSRQICGELYDDDDPYNERMLQNCVDIDDLTDPRPGRGGITTPAGPWRDEFPLSEPRRTQLKNRKSFEIDCLRQVVQACRMLCPQFEFNKASYDICIDNCGCPVAGEQCGIGCPDSEWETMCPADDFWNVPVSADERNRCAWECHNDLRDQIPSCDVGDDWF